MQGYTLAPHTFHSFKNNCVALVAQENRGWAIVTEQEYKIIKDYFSINRNSNQSKEVEITRATLDKLYNLGLVQKNGYYPDHCYKKTTPYPESLLIKMTGECNFKCAYCYDFSPQREKNQISAERIIATIDQIISKTKKLNITFHGGEPLLRFTIIKEVVNYCTRNFTDKKIRYALQTNGSLFNKEIVEFLEMHNFSVGISLDGIWSETDKLRTPKDVEFKSASQKFIYLLDKYNDFVRQHCGVLAVLCRSSIKRLPEYVLWLQEKGISGFSTTVLDPTGRAADIKEEEISAEDIIELYKTWIKLIKAGEIHSIKISNLLSYIDNLCSFDPPNFCQKGPCGASGEFLVLDADGSFRSCDCVIHDYFILGDAKTDLDDVIHSDRRKKIIKRYEQLSKYSECSKCTWMQLCGGTCVAKAIGHSSDINYIYPIECELTKFLYSMLLNEYSENPDSILFRYHQKNSKIKKIA